jgi:spore maturation protein CgeB
LWSSNFYPALKQLGHQIIESQIDLLPASRFMQIAQDFTPEEKEVRSRLTQKIIDEVREAHQKTPIDLFLSYFYNSHFDPAGFEEIHKLGIPTVNFYCNSIYQFELVSAIAPSVNFAWHTEKDARSQYLEVGANPIWVQMGADPEVYYPVPNVIRQPKACFLGQRYADREQYLAKLITENIPVNIYGRGWGADPPEYSESTEETSEPETSYLGRKIHQPGKLASYTQVIAENFQRHGLIGGIERTISQFNYRRKNRQLLPLLASAAQGYADSIPHTFSSHEVVLNFSNVWADGRPGSKLIPHVRLRDFEAPMCRTCYLTGYTAEIEEFYEIGKEIDTYHSSEELVDKTRFYLARPTEAEKIREAGYKRALNDHTWKMRFKELFKEIGLNSV